MYVARYSVCNIWWTRANSGRAPFLGPCMVSRLVQVRPVHRFSAREWFLGSCKFGPCMVSRLVQVRPVHGFSARASSARVTLHGHHTDRWRQCRPRRDAHMSCYPGYIRMMDTNIKTSERFRALVCLFEGLKAHFGMQETTVEQGPSSQSTSVGSVSFYRRTQLSSSLILRSSENCQTIVKIMHIYF